MVNLIRIIVGELIEMPPLIWHTLMCIVDAFYFIADILLYILILMRISVPFQVNRITIYFLSLLIIIYLVTSIIYCFGLLLFYEQHHIFEIFFMTLMCTDFVLNLAISVIFALKMTSLISNVDPLFSNEAEKNVNLIANTVIKHCLLFSIAMIVNQGFYTIGFYRDFTQTHTPKFGNIFLSITALGNIINIIVLWLVLRINYDIYIFVCGSCHKLIGKCCFKDIDSTAIVNNPYVELNVVEEYELK